MRFRRALGTAAVLLLVGAAGRRVLPRHHDPARHFDDERVVRLLKAAARRDTHGVSAALRDGADLDAPSRGDDPLRAGITPLHYAAEFLSPEAVRLLLHGGADPLATTGENGSGHTVPAYSLLRNTTQNLAVLLEHDPALAESPFRGGSSLLHGAVLHGRAEALLLLIAAGADLNSQDPAGGATPLHTAATVRNADACLTLVRKGADGSLLNAQGDTFASLLERAAEGSCGDDFDRKRALILGELDRRAGVLARN